MKSKLCSPSHSLVHLAMLPDAHIATELYGFIYHVYLGIALHLPWYMNQS
jgi:hypothetical protein